MATKKVAVSIRDKGHDNNLAEVLLNLHRPLEEHWAGSNKKSTKALDALSSDYTYKHHITRLEDLYMNHKLDPTMNQPPVLGTPNISPMTLLYGTNGIKRWEKLPEYEELKEAREKGWNPYTIVKRRPVVYERKSAIHEKRVPPEPPSPQTRGRSASASPNRGRERPSSASSPSSSSFSQTATTTVTFADEVNTKEQHQYQQQQGAAANVRKEEADSRSRCDNEELTDEDLVMLGMYRLDARQAQIYKQFVQMLVHFDPHDQECVLQDAAKDAMAMSLLARLGSSSSSSSSSGGGGGGGRRGGSSNANKK